MTYELLGAYTSSPRSYPQFVDEIEEIKIYSKISGLLLKKTGVVHFCNIELDTYKFSSEYQFVYQGVEVVSIYADFIIISVIAILLLISRYIRKSRKRKIESLSVDYMNFE